MKLKSGVRRDESGLGLIELIVAIVVSGIVLAVVATILVNSWSAQEKVLSVTRATNSGQVIGAAIERAVRNSVDLRITDAADNPVATGGSGSVLWVRTSLGGAQRCQGFRLIEGAVQIGRSDTSKLLASKEWPEWSPSVKVGDPTTSFTLTLSKELTYAFSMSTDAAAVDFGGSIAIRSDPLGAADKGVDACW